MEEGVRPISHIKTTHLSLQIIISILTIIKLYINFNEIKNEYFILLIIDSVINFTILILVIITPNVIFKLSYILCILGPIWIINIPTGLILSFNFYSNEFLGIYNFALYVRIPLLFLFFVMSAMYYDLGP